jgi:hypothetical protein
MATATEQRPIAPGLAVAVVSAGALLTSTSAGADALRCGSKLITDGDTQEKVLQYCGEPVERTRTWITRQPRFEYGGREIPFEGSEDVPVDLWTYDFGSSRLMHRIRFVAGKVDSIEALEHGTSR